MSTKAIKENILPKKNHPNDSKPRILPARATPQYFFWNATIPPIRAKIAKIRPITPQIISSIPAPIPPGIMDRIDAAVPAINE